MKHLKLSSQDIIQLPLEVGEENIEKLNRFYFKGIEPYYGIEAMDGETVQLNNQIDLGEGILYSVLFMGYEAKIYRSKLHEQLMPQIIFDNFIEQL